MLRNSATIFVSLGFAVALSVARIPLHHKYISPPLKLRTRTCGPGWFAGRWRAVQTIFDDGKLEPGGISGLAFPCQVQSRKSDSPKTLPFQADRGVQLPFVMELERSRKIRFELQFNGQTANSGV